MTVWWHGFNEILGHHGDHKQNSILLVTGDQDRPLIAGLNDRAAALETQSGAMPLIVVADHAALLQ